jgi:hypothetical protein
VLFKCTANPPLLVPAMVPTAMKQKIEAIIRDKHVEGATLDELADTYKVNFPSFFLTNVLTLFFFGGGGEISLK